MLPTPTVRIEVPKPLWHRVLQKLAMAGGVLLALALAFRAGQHFPLPPAAEPVPVAMAVPAPPEPAVAAAPAPLPPATPDASPAEQDGLELKAFSVAQDPALPGQLRYRLTLANSGRKFNGTLQFAVAGEQEGKPATWRYPAAGDAPDPKLKVEVSRFLRTAGVIPLPDGFTPRNITVDLLEPSGVRLSQQTRMGRTS